MAGIFADEGITGTSTKKRTEFLRMIRQCKQKKIDLILTKSIQRFARNTLDCINYTRILRQHPARAADARKSWNAQGSVLPALWI